MTDTKIDLSQYHNTLNRKHQIIRLICTIVWGLFARPLPRSVGSAWKRFLLRSFGAKIDSTAVVYSSAKVYYPANLKMDAYSCLASDVDCYNVAPIYWCEYYDIARSLFMYSITRYYKFSQSTYYGFNCH